MTIPQQECKEKKVPKCQIVSREECKMVPKETCTTIKEKTMPGQCRINTRLECEDRPRQKCGKKIKNVCKKVIQPKCSDRRTESCGMECQQVHWCKVCQGGSWHNILWIFIWSIWKKLRWTDVMWKDVIVVFIIQKYQQICLAQPKSNVTVRCRGKYFAKKDKLFRRTIFKYQKLYRILTR